MGDSARLHDLEVVPEDEQKSATAPRERAVTAPDVPGAEKFDLGAPEYYLNRELTWLAFNRRVLHEAQDKRNPLLERVKFLAIVSSNLDEFFMKRIGGLKTQVGAGVKDRTVDGRTPQQQIDECYKVVRDIEEQCDALLPLLLDTLRTHGIEVLSYAELGEQEKRVLREHYIESIFPLVTPQGFDPAHPFPFISNLSLNLFVTLHYRDEPEELLRARVKVPVGQGIPRFLRVGEAGQRFVPLEQVMRDNLDLLFPKMEVVSCELFLVTRNANSSRDEDKADDLLAMIESEVRDRRFASIVRMVVDRSMGEFHRGMLAAELGLSEADVFFVDGLLAMKDFFELVGLDVPELHDPPHHPLDHTRLDDTRSIFHTLREAGTVLLQHPYESFATSVERFLKEASRDPKVLAIKMTLYRTSRATKVIDYLIDAAQNGKQVAVVVELKARFDEAANIRWASRLEEAGIHVTYGVVGLKTHSKVILVVRRDYSRPRRYAHIGTGNYHAGTARLYSDLGILTCDDEIGQDLTEFFNYLTTGYTPKRHYSKILPAPKLMKRSLLDKIRREIVIAQAGEQGLIQFKVNALEDSDITRALYEAALAGVRIDLIVRDTCRLRPGISGLTENVRVISVVGRFLEHTRIYYFLNGGEEEYYIGSADTMSRNLENRVEVLAPVLEPTLCADIRSILDEQLTDQRNVWDMQSDGTYVQRQPLDADDAGCQVKRIRSAEERRRAAGRLKRRRSETISRRNVGRSG
jgi:polyphosphate kinase